MIVCHCAVVTDRDVREALNAGAATVRDVCRATGAARRCRGCLSSIEAIVASVTDRSLEAVIREESLP
jgi:bacterioferritin-associated ferredoxin